jgi:Zn-dependent protease with chaperone function
MLNRIRLVLVILTIPVIALGVAWGIQARYNSEIRAYLRSQYPNADQAAIAQITLDELCENPQTNLRDICRTNAKFNWLITAAVSAGFIGLALLLAIGFAGRIAHNRRNLLLYLFKPGLYLTAVTLVALTVVHAALAMSAIYYGESALIGRIHIGIIAIIALGALGGVIVIARNVFSLVKKAHVFVIGANLSRAEAPQLWNHVEQIADRLGALHPEAIVVGLEPNFFVTEADVVCLSGNLSGRTLYCSLPLCRILSKNEFSAVIGHELGHFQGLDTKFSESFYPIHRGTALAIASLQQTGGEGWASIALLPAIAIFSYFFECFSVAESRISRDRELAADQSGASLNDSATMASALVKVHAFSGLWDNLKTAAEAAVQDRKAFANVSKAFAEAAANSAKPELLVGLAATKLSHPTDSHPPLGVRLESLAITLDHVSGASLAINPADAAINLIPEPEKREEEISRTFQVTLAEQLGIDLGSESLSQVEFSLSPATDVFSYMCPACQSFQRSDVNVCLKCGAKNPHLTNTGFGN